MKSLKKLLLTGILTAGFAVSSMMGVANAQTLSYAGGSLDMDIPYEITETATESFSTTINGMSSNVNFASFSTPVFSSDVDKVVMASGMNFVMTTSGNKILNATDVFNSPDFNKNLFEYYKKSLKDNGLKISNISFSDDNINGIPVKRAETTVTANDKTCYVDLIVLCKDNTIWLVSVFGYDHDAINQIVNTIQ